MYVFPCDSVDRYIYFQALHSRRPSLRFLGFLSQRKRHVEFSSSLSTTNGTHLRCYTSFSMQCIIVVSVCICVHNLSMCQTNNCFVTLFLVGPVGSGRPSLSMCTKTIGVHLIYNNSNLIIFLTLPVQFIVAYIHLLYLCMFAQFIRISMTSLSVDVDLVYWYLCTKFIGVCRLHVCV